MTMAANPACQRCGLWQRPCACSNFGEAHIGALPLTPELTLDDIDAHLKTLGLRSRASWRGGEWTVQLTARREEHQKNVGRRAFGRAALIEEAFARALEEWEKTL